eukprot:570185-Amphidinium_carterae.1
MTRAVSTALAALGSMRRDTHQQAKLAPTPLNGDLSVSVSTYGIQALPRSVLEVGLNILFSASPVPTCLPVAEPVVPPHQANATDPQIMGRYVALPRVGWKAESANGATFADMTRQASLCSIACNRPRLNHI